MVNASRFNRAREFIKCVCVWGGGGGCGREEWELQMPVKLHVMCGCQSEDERDLLFHMSLSVHCASLELGN